MTPRKVHAMLRLSSFGCVGSGKIVKNGELGALRKFGDAKPRSAAKRQPKWISAVFLNNLHLAIFQSRDPGISQVN